MKKILILLTIVGILACAAACAAPFLYLGGTEDGFTFEAFDTGQSPYWLVALLVFFGVLAGVGIVIYKVMEVKP